MLSIFISDREDAREAERRAENAEHFDKQIARTHAMGCFRQCSIFIENSFQVAPLYCADECSDVIPRAGTLKRQASISWFRSRTGLLPAGPHE